MRQIRLTFEEKDAKKLFNAKEVAVINGECKNWEEFILMKCGVKK